ncbi:MAG: hypothetical protein IKY12_05485, partial [Clostridia bacterium]|nr:hypothetical protein [Clostridia bacterium]
SDTFNGSISAPLKTLKAAINALEGGGKIIVTDKYTLTEFDKEISGVKRFVEPYHSGKITVTALAPEYDYRKDGACIYFPSEHGYDASGDLCFENILFESDATTIYFTANFNAVEFGDGFDCNNTQGEAKKLFLVGGYNCPEVTTLPSDKDVNITVKSGKFSRIICFGYQKGAGTYTFTGTANVNILGGRIDRFYGGSTLNHYSGSLNLFVDGGAFSDVYLGGDATRRLNGNATVNLKSGKIVSALYINNVIGDTDITLDELTLGKIEVTYGNDTIKNAAFGKRIAIRYNSLVHSADFVNSIEGITKAERFGIVYVKSGANGDGMSESSPCGSLADAVSALASGGGDIVIIGEYNINGFTAPTHSQPVTLKGGTLILDGSFTLGGETVLDLSLSGSGKIIGNVTIADGTNVNGKISLEGDSITVQGGNFDSISGKSLTLLGGEIKNAYVSGEALLDGAKIGMLSADGDSFKLTVESGNVDSCNINCKSATLITGVGVDNVLKEKLAPHFDKKSGENVVFVRGGANGSGVSADYALPSLEEAFGALKDGGTVVVCGEITVNNTY